MWTGPKQMKKEELEANGEEGTKYRKEPSPCPICGKVSLLLSAPLAAAQLLPEVQQSRGLLF